MIALVLPLFALPDTPAPTAAPRSPAWAIAAHLAQQDKALHATTWYNVLSGRNPPSLRHYLTMKKLLGKADAIDAALLTDLESE